MENKESILETIMRTVYNDQRATVRLPGSSICPNCYLEPALVISEDKDRRVFCCLNCGTHYYAPKPLLRGAA